MFTVKDVMSSVYLCLSSVTVILEYKFTVGECGNFVIWESIDIVASMAERVKHWGTVPGLLTV